LEGGRLLGIEGLSAELGRVFEGAKGGAREVAGALRQRLVELGSGGDAEDDQTFLVARRV
jgi:hypothetical protein